MKNNYVLALLMLLCLYGHAQLVCPNSIKTSGGSTPSEPTFVLTNGQACTGWPLTITIDGTLTYNYVSCSGVNLKYVINSGSPPPTYEMTVDFGGGTVCSYDAAGNLVVLSSDDFKQTKISVAPNPTSGIISINLDPSNTLENVSLYAMTGQMVYKGINQQTLDVSSLASGIYVLRVQANTGTVTKRVVKY